MVILLEYCVLLLTRNCCVVVAMQLLAAFGLMLMVLVTVVSLVITWNIEDEEISLWSCRCSSLLCGLPSESLQVLDLVLKTWMQKKH